jgi:hypothetical protein
VLPLLQRLPVEEGRHLRHRLGVEVDSAGEVLVVGGELVADLGVELVDEARGRHGHVSLVALRRRA